MAAVLIPLGKTGIVRVRKVAGSPVFSPWHVALHSNYQNWTMGDFLLDGPTLSYLHLWRQGYEDV
jgi:hypothetical protein